MTSLLSIVLIVLLAFLGSVIFKKIKIRSTFLESIAYTGMFYIVFGYLLSPNVFNFFDEKILKNLNILFALVLGWAGFLVGLQAKITGMLRFPPMYFRYTITNIVLVFLLSLSGFWYLLTVVFRVPLEYQNLLVLTLAGSITSPIMLAVVVRGNRVQARLAHLLQFQAAFDNLLGILTIGMVEISLGLYNQEPLWLVFTDILVVVFVALLAGGIYTWLAKDKMSAEEETLYIIGLLMFVVGTALYFGLSLLFAGLIFGLVLANSTNRARSLYRSIQQMEKPMYILLLVLAGANLSVQPAIALIVVFFLWRIVSKVLAEMVANQTIKKAERHRGWLGLANIGMGGLPLAIVLDFYLINPGPKTRLMIFIIFVALVFQDGMALQYLKERLVRK